MDLQLPTYFPSLVGFLCCLCEGGNGENDFLCTVYSQLAVHGLSALCLIHSRVRCIGRQLCRAHVAHPFCMCETAREQVDGFTLISIFESFAERKLSSYSYFSSPLDQAVLMSTLHEDLQVCLCIL
jgi:hypothetical protein